MGTKLIVCSHNTGWSGLILFVQVLFTYVVLYDSALETTKCSFSKY